MKLQPLIEKIKHYVRDNRQPIAYVIAGGYNTLFGFLAFAGLYLLLEHQLHYLIIASLSWILAVTNSFLVYRYWVFQSSGNLLLEYLKVYVVYGLSFFMGLALLFLLVEQFDLHPIAAQVIVIAITFVISYFGHSRFTFITKPDDPA